MKKSPSRIWACDWLVGSPMNIYAIEVVSLNDIGAARCVFVDGTVIGIVAALETSARTTRLNELDVVVIAHANATLGVSHPPSTSTGIVLTTRIAGVQPVDFLGIDTPSDCASRDRGNQSLGR